MLRDTLNNTLKEAIKAKDQVKVGTLRMVMAAIKDLDINARTSGKDVGDAEIAQMMQCLIKQRRDSVKMYEEGGRQELADKENKEIEIISSFLPKQLSDEEITAAVDAVIAQTGASAMKDMKDVMGGLRGSYAGQMDFSKAAAIIKERLS